MEHVSHELRDEDHAALIETLLHYDGAVVLSGYHNELYAPLEATGWDCLEVDVVCCAAGRTRTSGLLGPGTVSAKQRRVECIWRNQEAMRRLAHK